MLLLLIPLDSRVTVLSKVYYRDLDCCARAYERAATAAAADDTVD